MKSHRNPGIKGFLWLILIDASMISKSISYAIILLIAESSSAVKAGA